MGIRRRLSGSAFSSPAAAMLLVCIVASMVLPADIHARQADTGPVDEIVVTGIRPQRLPEVARSVTVITAADIAASPTVSLVDLLAREANVVMRSFTGNDKFASVDVRGMGDTSVSNVLVLVDGVQLNSPDLAGPDFASVALDQIERIEIVRGANSVRYGSGAVGGVINIITRSSTATRRFAGSVGGGSFGEAQAAGSAAFGGQGQGGSLRASSYTTDGYRENGELRRRDAGLQARARPFQALALDASLQWHRDDYGLPGPISAEAFRESDAARRASNAPDDNGESDTTRYRLSAGLDLPDAQQLALVAAWHERENRYVIGYTPLLTLEQQEDVISEDTYTVDLSYHLPLQALATNGAEMPGLDFGISGSSSDYRRQENGTDNVGLSSALDGRIDEYGIYAAASWRVQPEWLLSAGQRWNVTDSRSMHESLEEVCDIEYFMGIPVPVNCRDENLVGSLADDRWHDTASDVGIVWTAAPGLDLYLSHARAFRVPNVDELAQSDGQLVPQDSRHWDAGVRSQPFDGLLLGFALFEQRTDREILYGLDPDTGENVNRNADESTIRRGAEAELRWQIAQPLTLMLNAGYTRARFEETDAPVPLVPEWNVAANLQWRPVGSVVATVAGHYVGSRTDGNDADGNTFPRLSSYWLADIKIGWEYAAYRMTAGVHNLFDEVAATSAYSSRIYPLPSRSFHVDLAVGF
jgi:iron complex outermembrane receptor protein